MISVFECRRRIGGLPIAELNDLYRVKTWYLFGYIPIFRTYKQLTTRDPLPSEARSQEAEQ